MTQPCDLDAVDASAAIGARRLSSRELVESCIGRIERVDHAVNAVVARDFERARSAADAADRAFRRGDALGPLHGLPVGIKDLDDTAGLRTTYGSELFRDHVPAADQLLVASLRRAGAIVLGKTNTSEWGAGGNTRNCVYGATGNPFDPVRNAAGSSGGSAVALATGMVPLASGSDTAGSLRTPAAYCGVVGFRPTPGLVPSEKRQLGWLGLPTLGPMARTVADLCLLLAPMVSDDARDPLAATVRGWTTQRPEAFARPDPVALGSLRVAVSADLGFAPTERHIREVFARKVGSFASAFGAVEEAAPDCRDVDRSFEVLRAVTFLANHHDRVKADPARVGRNVRNNVEEGLGYSALDIVDAMKMQTRLYRSWHSFFETVDVIVTPAVTVGPRPWSELFPAAIDGVATRSYFHWLALAYAPTLVGHPALSLPVGLDDHGMPFGLQIIGRRGGDATVLAVAAALERHLAGDPGTARPKPDLDALAAAPPIRDCPGFLENG